MCRKKKHTKTDKDLNGNLGSSGSLTAVHKGDGILKGIRHETNAESKSVDHDGELFRESVIIKTETRASQKERERQAVERFLPSFNRENKTNFIVSDEIPEESDIKDIIIVEKDTKEKIGIQVTASDAEPFKPLNTKKTFSRQGNTYQIHRTSIRNAIKAKGKSKYSISDRRNTILLLDGWFGVSPQVLQRIKERDKDFLINMGYYQIWFVGTIDETIMGLY